MVIMFKRSAWSRWMRMLRMLKMLMMLRMRRRRVLFFTSACPGGCCTFVLVVVVLVMMVGQNTINQMSWGCQMREKQWALILSLSLSCRHPAYPQGQLGASFSAFCNKQNMTMATMDRNKDGKFWLLSESSDISGAVACGMFLRCLLKFFGKHFSAAWESDFRSLFLNSSFMFLPLVGDMVLWCLMWPVHCVCIAAELRWLWQHQRHQWQYRHRWRCSPEKGNKKNKNSHGNDGEKQIGEGGLEGGSGGEDDGDLMVL